MADDKICPVFSFGHRIEITRERLSHYDGITIWKDGKHIQCEFPQSSSVPVCLWLDPVDGHQ